jgi:hypothetical protein
MKKKTKINSTQLFFANQIEILIRIQKKCENLCYSKINPLSPDAHTRTHTHI